MENRKFAAADLAAAFRQEGAMEPDRVERHVSPRAGWTNALRVAAVLAVGLVHFAGRPPFGLAAGPSVSRAVDGTSQNTPPPAPTPLQDDANLHDIGFGGRTGWAVGDHGVIWQTLDGGCDWQLLPSPVDCALRSVSFLSDRVGWIAGGGTVPFARKGVGVLLATSDGGRHWNDLARGRLPQLHFVRFFTSAEGVLVGEATAEFPTGVLTTRDGGKTWNAVQGERHPGWRAADFLSPEAGITAGLNGAVARVESVMTDVRAGGFGRRGLHDVRLAANDVGWTVGDGALVLHTVDRGVVWQGPPTPLPEQASEIFDFHAVAVRGDKVWIAGAPGSVVWYSPDGGATWNLQRTGQTSPIERIAFQSDRLGFAVGAFGSILRTDDGGAGWQAARGGNRRAAVLAVPARPAEISFNVLAKEAGEMGYRGVVFLPYRGDGNGDSGLDVEFDVRLQDSVTAAAAAQGSCGWRFPLEIPGLDRDAEKLIADWMRRTEGKFQAAFYGDLVCQIRTWRPTVVIVGEPSDDDAAGIVLRNAVLDAVHRAGDPAFCTAHRDLAALAPWKVSRVFVRLPPASREGGDFLVNTYERLPRLRSMLATFATAAAGRLAPIDPDAPESEGYRLIFPAGRAGTGERAFSAPRDFFSALAIAPGSDSRRRLPDIDFEIDESMRRVAERDRNFRAIVRQQAKNPLEGAQLIGLLRTSTQGTDHATAALQLSTLADIYRRNNQPELSEATLIELVSRYPNEPATLTAMQWLLQYWIGAEPTYQRFRRPDAADVHTEFRASGVERAIENAVELAQADPKGRDPIQILPTPNTGQVTQRPGSLRTAQGDWLEVKLRQQREMALRLASLIRQKSPHLYRAPEIQLPLAVLLRQSGLASLPEDQPAGGKHDGQRGNDPNLGLLPAAFSLFERQEQQAVKCAVAETPPHLDGLFSDPCWQSAAEIPVTADDVPLGGDGSHALVLLSHDSRNLYFAISVPRAAGLRKDGPVTLGRKHDEDLSRYDRIALCFDVDRDFTTWYTIEIDQRGCVRESCWGDPNWNPSMGIATQADDERWRIEGAIPFRELVPRPPQRGESWGLAVIRTIPAVGLESWQHPSSLHPRPESFGALRFQ